MSATSGIKRLGLALAQTVRSWRSPAPEIPQTPVGRFKARLNEARIYNVSPRLQDLLLALPPAQFPPRLDAANLVIDLVQRQFAAYGNEALNALEAALENGRDPQQFLEITDRTKHPYLLFTALPAFYQAGYSDLQIEFLIYEIERSGEEQFDLYPALKEHLPEIKRLADDRRESSFDDYLAPLLRDERYHEYTYLAVRALPSLLEVETELTSDQILQLLFKAHQLFSSKLAPFVYKGIADRLRAGDNFAQIMSWLYSYSNSPTLHELDPIGMTAVEMRPENTRKD